jgi:hypothetical protein
MASHVDLFESASMLKAAVESVSDRATVGHIPGYGLVITAEWMGNMDAAKTRRRLQALLVGVAPTVEGLAPDERIAVSWFGTAFGEKSHHLVFSIRPDDPGSLEVFVDGKKD